MATAIKAALRTGKSGAKIVSGFGLVKQESARSRLGTNRQQERAKRERERQASKSLERGRRYQVLPPVLESSRLTKEDIEAAVQSLLLAV